MEKLKKVIANLRESTEFKNWIKDNPSAYISYCFNMVKGKDEMEDWQIGFYEPKSDRVSTFIVKKDCFELVPEQEVFKKDDMEVKELEISKVKVGVNEAIKKAEEFMSKEYPHQIGMKTILILQKLPGLGNIWNITYVTHGFQTLNMRISALSGDMLEHKLDKLIDFGASDSVNKEC